MIKVNSLNKSYDRGRHARQVLHDISFTLPDTGFVCILGPSGCGKTSLLNSIGGLDRFDRGSISTGDVSVSRSGTALYEAERNRSFGYIFQNYYLLQDHSVAYNVYMGLHSLDLSHSEKIARVREALQAVEMENYLRRTVGELSGGQQQRVAIARAIARKPRVIFADEPTGNLDEANTLNICSLLRRISKTSLVLMVTHEENIASFFADRIIRLEEGRIASDSERFDRASLSADMGKALYAGDYECRELSNGGVKLRFLREEGAENVELTVLALRDRVVIKLADPRTVSCGEPGQAPELREGKRPLLTLETLDAEKADSPLFAPQPQAQKKAGHGVNFPMMFSEARHLLGGRGIRRAGLLIFLVLLSLLTAFTVSDYITLSTIDPEDFIVSDSHILEIQIDQGKVMYEKGSSFNPVIIQYMDYLRHSGQDFYFIPHVSQSIEYSHDIFRQMDAISMDLGAFSYVPAQELDEATLIHGRAPEASDEIVVDRWILERAMEKDGILQNSISDVSYFLGRQLSFLRQSYFPTIVGISDCGEPSIFIHTAGIISIGVNGTAVTPLSELQSSHPGEYDDVVLGERECLVVVNNAGGNYRSAEGQVYTPSHDFVISRAIEAEVFGNIVIDDSQLDNMLWNMYSDRFYLYCADKQAMADFLGEKASEMETEGYAIITVIDRHSQAMDKYEAAAGKKADARSIVTFTVIALCMAMLYLLCRARAHERIGMLAVYRLLGIPGRKIALIFTLESLLLSLYAVLPTVAAAWFTINVGGLIPELELSLLFSPTAALATFAGIMVYHLLVSLLPLVSLLRLPPAVLAAKFDM